MSSLTGLTLFLALNLINVSGARAEVDSSRPATVPVVVQSLNSDEVSIYRPDGTTTVKISRIDISSPEHLLPQQVRRVFLTPKMEKKLFTHTASTFPSMPSLIPMSEAAMTIAECILKAKHPKLSDGGFDLATIVKVDGCDQEVCVRQIDCTVDKWRVERWVRCKPENCDDPIACLKDNSVTAGKTTLYKGAKAPHVIEYDKEDDKGTERAW